MSKSMSPRSCLLSEKRLRLEPLLSARRWAEAAGWLFLNPVQRRLMRCDPERSGEG
jgi:hypothetical protein